MNKFYVYLQNNSGGYYEIDNDKGVDECIVIESDCQEKADDIFWSLVEDYSDYCECCGVRWNGLFECVDDMLNIGCKYYSKSIHYSDGRIEKVDSDV